MRIVWQVQSWQFGGAYTLPGAYDEAAIRAKRLEILLSPGYEHIRVHERFHAWTVQQCGARWYWRRVVLWARLMSLLRHGNLLAEDDPVELEAKAEEDRFLETGESPFADNGSWTFQQQEVGR